MALVMDEGGAMVSFSVDAERRDPVAVGFCGADVWLS